MVHGARTISDLVVESLLAAEVDTVFGIPGTHNLGMYEALARRDVRHVTPRHEQGAAFAADGHARVTGRPGVLITTSGPAILNALTGLAQSYSDSVPVVAICPGLPTDAVSGRGWLHGAKDQTGAVDAVTRWCHRVSDAKDLARTLADALAPAPGRAGPAVIEIPYDLLDLPTDVAVIETPKPQPYEGDRDVGELARVLGDARRPVVIAGRGAENAAYETRRLAETIGAAVVTTANAKGLLDESSPWSLGARLNTAPVLDLVADADTVLVVGSELGTSELWFREPKVGGTLVRVDIDPPDPEHGLAPDLTVRDDAAWVLAQVVRTLEPVDDLDVRRDRIARVRTAAAAESRQQGERWVAWLDALADVLDGDAVVVGDSSMSCYYGVLGNLPMARPGRFLYPAGFGTLGYAVPAAVGALCADPERQVVTVSGDGGLMFSLAEIATAAAEGLALPIIVFDNAGFGEIREEMDARGSPRVAVDLPPVDLPAAARALGAYGAVVTDPRELANQVRAARTRNAPTLLVVAEPPLTTAEETHP